MKGYGSIVQLHACSGTSIHALCVVHCMYRHIACTYTYTVNLTFCSYYCTTYCTLGTRDFVNATHFSVMLSAISTLYISNAHVQSWHTVCGTAVGFNLYCIVEQCSRVEFHMFSELHCAHYGLQCVVSTVNVGKWLFLHHATRMFLQGV